MIEYAEQITKKEKKPYEKFHNILNKEKYFNLWDKKTLAEITEEDKDGIYEKYKAKCKVFQRDDFTCQNKQKVIVGDEIVELRKCLNCKNVKYYHKLTFHHVKFKKNNGENKARNGVTLCYGSHNGYHKAKGQLVFDNISTLPTHIRGHTFKLKKPDKVNWKTVRKDMKQLRQEIKFKLDESIKKLPVGQRKWFKLKEERILVLLKWLYMPYDEFDD